MRGGQSRLQVLGLSPWKDREDASIAEKGKMGACWEVMFEGPQTPHGEVPGGRGHSSEHRPGWRHMFSVTNN